MWLTLAALAIIPILRIRWGFPDSTIAVKPLVGLLETAFAFAVFTQTRVDWHERMRAAPVVWAVLAAWLIWALFCVSQSGHFASSLLRQAEWLGHGLFAYAVFVLLQSRPAWSLHAARLLTVGLVLYFIEFSFFRFTLPWADGYNWSTGTPGFSNVRHLGYYVTALLPLAWYLAVARVRHERSGRIDLVIGLAGMTLAWCFIFWAGGRGPVVALAATWMSLAVLPATRNAITRSLAVMSGTAIPGLLLAWMYAVPGLGIGRITSRLIESESIAQQSSGRMMIWEHALGLIRESPLTGLGPDGYLFHPVGEALKFVHPHNFVLQSALEWGVPGAVLFGGLVLALVAWLTFTVSRGLSATERTRHVPLLWAALSLLALSLIDGPLYHAQSSMLFAIAAALAAAHGPRLPVTRGFHAVPAAAGIVCALVFLLHAVSLAQALGPRDQAYPDAKIQAVFPSGLADSRAAFALRGHIRSCLETEPARCRVLLRIASAHTPPPHRDYYARLAGMFEHGRYEEAERFLDATKPWGFEDH